MAVITGTAGNNTLTGTTGADEIYGLLGNDRLFGGLGNDTLVGDLGIDSLVGGDGDDYLDDILGIGNTLQGGVGNDQIDGSNRSIIDGGIGTDLLTFYASSVTNLNFTATGNATSADGTNIIGIEEFSFIGSAGNDSINAASTNYGNTLDGNLGNDTLISGSGNDFIFDEYGINIINSGAGDDFITASIGSNINGGIGFDNLTLTGVETTQDVNLTFTANGVATGTDGTAISGVERFVFTGGSGNSLINAAVTTYSNDLTGGSGNDTLIGGSTNDFLTGGSGNNRLVGGAGNDYYIVGSTGSNIIDDSSGVSDSLTISANINFATAFRKSGTNLLIDVNGDQIFDTINDTSILNFYNQSGAAGSGFIETIQGRSTQELIKPVTSDFGNDRRSDILWRQGNGSVTLWQMDGTNIAANSLVSSPVDASWQIISNRDFNADGTADILWNNTISGATSLWQMNGATIVTAGLITTSTDPGWQISATGDFNGDKKADILWRNINGDVAIWQMDAQRIATTKVLGNVDLSWSSTETGDFNGDNKSDIIWRNDNGDVAIWLMDGSNVQTARVLGNVPLDWKIAGVNDFNDDGNADVIWQNNDGSIAVWQLNGTDISYANIIGNVPTGFNIVGIGDFNADSRGDLLLRNAQGNNVIWNTNGTQLTTLDSVANSDSSWILAALTI
jgi:Ca2+-binding RTX toxin-like protein